MDGQKCPIHQKPTQLRKEDNFFFALSKYQQQLEKLLEDTPEFVRPSFRRNEVHMLSKWTRNMWCLRGILQCPVEHRRQVEVAWPIA